LPLFLQQGEQHVAKQNKWGPISEETYTVRIRRDDETGVAVTEYWIRADTGKQHRIDGPASISRDPKTGIVTHEMWIQNGEMHRTDGPANILRKHDTGRVYCSEWMVHDKKIKPPKPSRPNAGNLLTTRSPPSKTKKPSL
jgi:hypothetical protein